MSEYPKSTPSLHRFEKEGRYYVANLFACQGWEVDPLTWDILSLCESLSEVEIVQQLEKRYPREEILNALSALSSLMAEGLLVQKESDFPQEEDVHPKLLVAGNPLHSPLRGLLEALENEAHL